MLLRDVMPSVLSYLSKAISVERLAEGRTLKAARETGSKTDLGESDFKDERCGEVIFPQAHMAGTGAGVENADLIVYITDAPSTWCHVRNIFDAGSCRHAVNGRPLFGYITLCGPFFHHPKMTELYSKAASANRDVFVAMTRHITQAMLHILGLGGRHFPRFVNDHGVLHATEHDSEFQHLTGSRRPVSKKVLQVNNDNEKSVLLITPFANEAVREHFNLNVDIGIKLHCINDDSSGHCEYFHTHARYVEDDIMTGDHMYDRNAVVSTITFAWLRSTGWYLVNQDYAGLAYWGRSFDGTSNFTFLHSSCLLESGRRRYPIDDTHFCIPKHAALNVWGCDVRHSRVSRCGTVTVGDSVPTNYQYFPTNPALIGDAGQNSLVYRSKLVNYCPIFRPLEGARPCNVGRETGNTEIYFTGEVFGPKSRCVVSTIHSAVIPDEVKLAPVETTGRCYETVCIPQDRTSPYANKWIAVEFIVHITSTETETIRCSVGDEHTLKGTKTDAFNGQLRCPEVLRMCLDYPCRNNGRLLHGMCFCQPGFAGLHCELRDTQANRKRFLTNLNFGGLDGVSLIVGDSYFIPVHIPEQASFRPRFRLADSSDELPTGLTVDASSGAIVGTPTASAGCRPYTVEALASLTISDTDLPPLPRAIAGGFPSLDSPIFDSLNEHSDSYDGDYHGSGYTRAGDSSDREALAGHSSESEALAGQSSESGALAGHLFVGDSSVGHSSVGHSSVGHSSVGHLFVGDSSVGHSSVGHGEDAVTDAQTLGTPPQTNSGASDTVIRATIHIEVVDVNHVLDRAAQLNSRCSRRLTSDAANEVISTEASSTPAGIYDITPSSVSRSASPNEMELSVGPEVSSAEKDNWIRDIIENTDQYSLAAYPSCVPNWDIPTYQRDDLEP